MKNSVHLPFNLIPLHYDSIFNKRLYIPVPKERRPQAYGAVIRAWGFFMAKSLWSVLGLSRFPKKGQNFNHVMFIGSGRIIKKENFSQGLFLFSFFLFWVFSFFLFSFKQYIQWKLNI